MFGDKVDCQSRKCGKMTTSDGAEKGGCDGAAQCGVMIESEVVFGFVKSEHSVGLMS
jgi:hypothetical protein